MSEQMLPGALKSTRSARQLAPGRVRTSNSSCYRHIDSRRLRSWHTSSPSWTFASSTFPSEWADERRWTQKQRAWRRLGRICRRTSQRSEGPRSQPSPKLKHHAAGRVERRGSAAASFRVRQSFALERSQESSQRVESTPRHQSIASLFPVSRGIMRQASPESDGEFGNFRLGATRHQGTAAEQWAGSSDRFLAGPAQQQARNQPLVDTSRLDTPKICSRLVRLSVARGLTLSPRATACHDNAHLTSCIALARPSLARLGAGLLMHRRPALHHRTPRR
jgi:hypothetical protein